MTRLLCVLVLLPTLVLAVAQPDMTRQKTWDEKDKDAFYEWLEEQRGQAPAAADQRLVVPPTQTIEALQAVLDQPMLDMRHEGFDHCLYAAWVVPDAIVPESVKS